LPYEKEDICMSYEEEDACISYEEEDACMSNRGLLLFTIASRASPTAASAARRAESISSARKN
jgi:hypothetical protein